MPKKAESVDKPTIECVVRFDCHLGKHDEIIELSPEEARAAQGCIDAHPDAVKAIRARKD